MRGSEISRTFVLEIILVHEVDLILHHLFSRQNSHDEGLVMPIHFKGSPKENLPLVP